MKKICFFIILLMALLLFGCSNNEISSSNIEIEDATDGVLQSCFECQTEYSTGGYIVTANNQSISLCKNCRDNLMQSNGFLLVDNKKWYLFNEDAIYRDDLVSFNIPKMYEQTEVDSGLEIYEAQFVHRQNPDIIIVFNREDFFEDTGISPTTEDRQSMTLSSSTDAANSNLVEILAPDDCTGYNIEHIQNQTFFIYYTDLDIIQMSTIKDGVFYSFVYCDFSENTNNNLAEIMLSDLHPFAESLAYPNIDTVTKYYDGYNDEDETIEDEPDSEPYFVTTEKDPLNMRERPQKDSQIVGKIPKGADIEIDSFYKNWGHTYWNGVSGWVNLDYCTPGNNPDPTIISLNTIVYFTEHEERFHLLNCPTIKSKDLYCMTIDWAYSAHNKTPCKICFPHLDMADLY